MNAVRMDTLSGRVTRTSYPALASCFLAVFLSLLLSSGAQIMFSSANAISSNSTSTNPGTVAPGDLNHDGYTDVVVSQMYSGSIGAVVWYAGSSLTTFASSPSTLYSPCYMCTDVFLFDINADGWIDVFFASEGYGSNYGIVGYLLNPKSSSAASSNWAMTQLLTSTTTPSFQRVRLVDVSRDGYADLIAVSQSDNQVSVMINNGTGGFGTAKNLTNVTAAWDVSVADVNGDGRMDIGVSGGNCSTNLSFGVYWFQNTGGYPTPSWSSAKTIAVSAPGGYAAQRLSLGDINNDGYSDVVVLWGQNGLGCGNAASTGVGYLAWYQSYGGSGWTAYNISTSSPRGGAGLQLIDFDADGNLDILAASKDDGAYYYYNNNGGTGLSFTNQTVGAGFTQAQSVVGYDVNQDGLMDVVADASLNGNVIWYETVTNPTPTKTTSPSPSITATVSSTVTCTVTASIWTTVSTSPSLTASPSISPSATPSVNPSIVPWPMFGQNQFRTSSSQFAGLLTTTPSLQYSIVTGGATTSAVIGLGNIVYFASADSKIYAFNATAGSLLWSYTTGGAITATPVINSVIGAVCTGGADSYFYCISASSGSLVWKVSLSGTVNPSPVMSSSGVMYLTVGNSTFYSVSTSGVATSYAGSGTTALPPPLILPSGNIAFSSCDNSNRYVYVMTPTMSLYWKWTGGVGSIPMLGISYGSSTGYIYYGDSYGYLLALVGNGTSAPSGGSNAFTSQVGSSSATIASAPAIDAAGNLYFGAGSTLYSYTSSGTKRWSYAVTGTIVASPSIDASGYVYIGTKSGYVYCVSSLGVSRWSYHSSSSSISASIAIGGDGSAWIGSDSTTMFSIRDPTTTPSPTPLSVASATSSDTSTTSLTVTPSSSSSLTLTTSFSPSVSITVSSSATPSMTVTTSVTTSLSSTLSSAVTVSVTSTGSSTVTSTTSQSCSASSTVSAVSTVSVTSSSTITESVTLTVTISGSLTASPSSSNSVTVTLSITTTSSTSNSVTLSSTIAPSISTSASASFTTSPSTSPTISVTTSVTFSTSGSTTPTCTATTTSTGTGTVAITTSQSLSPSSTTSTSVSLTTTPTVTSTVTSSISGSLTASPSSSASVTPSLSVTTSFGSSLSVTPSSSPTVSYSASDTSSPTVTSTVTSSRTDSATVSVTSSLSTSGTPAATLSTTMTASASFTLTCSGSISGTSTLTLTSTSSGTWTTTMSPSSARSASATETVSVPPSSSPLPTVILSGTNSATATTSPTMTQSGSISLSNTLSVSPSVAATASESTSPTSTVSSSPLPPGSVSCVVSSDWSDWSACVPDSPCSSTGLSASILPILVFPSGDGQVCPPASDLQRTRACTLNVSSSCIPSNCSTSGTCGASSECGLCNQGQPCAGSNDCSTNLTCGASGTCISSEVASSPTYVLFSMVFAGVSGDTLNNPELTKAVMSSVVSSVQRWSIAGLSVTNGTVGIFSIVDTALSTACTMMMQAGTNTSVTRGANVTVIIQTPTDTISSALADLVSANVNALDLEVQQDLSLLLPGVCSVVNAAPPSSFTSSQRPLTGVLSSNKPHSTPGSSSSSMLVLCGASAAGGAAVLVVIAVITIHRRRVKSRKVPVNDMGFESEPSVSLKLELPAASTGVLSGRPVRAFDRHRVGSGGAKVTLSPLLMTTAEMRASMPCSWEAQDKNPEAVSDSSEVMIVTENPLSRKGGGGYGTSQAMESKELHGVPIPRLGAGQLAMYSGAVSRTVALRGTSKLSLKRDARAVKGRRHSRAGVSGSGQHRAHFGPALTSKKEDERLDVVL